jgi:hypothetical protein
MNGSGQCLLKMVLLCCGHIGILNFYFRLEIKNTQRYVGLRGFCGVSGMALNGIPLYVSILLFRTFAICPAFK